MDNITLSRTWWRSVEGRIEVQAFVDVGRAVSTTKEHLDEARVVVSAIDGAIRETKFVD